MIQNNPQQKPKVIEDLRKAVEHRAVWMYLLIDEAVKQGLNPEFARKAIFRCGCFHGDNKFRQTSSLTEFAQQFADPNVTEIFEMDVHSSDQELAIDFHYCPLVAAWLKFTSDEKKIAELCDIAMDGDRGIASRFDTFDFSLGQTIAKGGKVCQIRFKKK
ncbi:MAG: L-2-amino-thiazoline-4-carboxylic acid hydrolase [Treponema sp.]|jgi:hypothetical protein|nr:L-2-amino-thiazoline-4-carboxylic acid hydrolase [Treponema sp.]